MSFFSVCMGTLHYEFWMQLRRRSVWLVLLVVSLMNFALFFAFGSTGFLVGHYSRDQHVWIPPATHDAVFFWTQLFAWFLPLGVGLVLADRLARDRRTRVDEIFATCATSLAARLLGKFLGCTLATLIPVVLLDAIGIGYILTVVPDWSLPWLAVQAFAAVVLPGIIFAAGVSLAIPVILNVPVYQLLFIGYWFWADLLPPRFKVPTPVSWMTNATGPWAQEAFFHFQWVFLILNPSIAQGIASIALLVGIGFCAVFVAWGYLRWQQVRR